MQKKIISDGIAQSYIKVHRNLDFLYSSIPRISRNQLNAELKNIYQQAKNVGIYFDQQAEIKIGEVIVKFLPLINFLQQQQKKVFVVEPSHIYLTELAEACKDVTLINTNKRLAEKIDLLLSMSVYPCGMTKEYSKLLPSQKIIDIRHLARNVGELWPNHASQTYIYLLSGLAGIKYFPVLPAELEITVKDLLSAKQKLHDTLMKKPKFFQDTYKKWKNSTNFIFNPGVGVTNKVHYQQLRQWHKNNFIELGKMLLDNYPGSNVFIYKRIESEAIADDIYKTLHKYFTGRTYIFMRHPFRQSINMPELIALMKDIINVAISPDTSFMHLSAAGNIPTIGIFGPTDVRQWGALSSDPKNVLLIENNSCNSKSVNADEAICLRYGCEKSCIDEISPQAIFNALPYFLKRNNDD
ncbi:MAG: glycosyltransferase family 9 protein [Candidatus Margulisbacteria bacterium]|nr:glycosyltransferase family 9 protein [Candidatus Margulisiibacteriota bacterium]